MHSVTPEALYAQLQQEQPPVLIDVREPDEHTAFNLGGELIPLQEITNHVSRIPQDLPVVLYCHKGIRSAIAIQRLTEKYPFNNLINLAGGIEAWQRRFPTHSG